MKPRLIFPYLLTFALGWMVCLIIVNYYMDKGKVIRDEKFFSEQMKHVPWDKRIDLIRHLFVQELSRDSPSAMQEEFRKVQFEYDTDFIKNMNEVTEFSSQHSGLGSMSDESREYFERIVKNRNMVPTTKPSP